MCALYGVRLSLCIAHAYPEFTVFLNIMTKRFQVFVSSTYADLREERAKVLQTLMEMDCIPAGMEMFPASDEEQWEFIKKVIDDCDYYLLIIGGRYGTLTPEGISYTEKEYHYAVEKGVKVIALLHQDPDAIPAGKTDKDPDLQAKLLEFRNQVADGRLVKFWSNATELPGLVSLSLSKTIKTYPAVGWVRASQATSQELLSEINDLRKENIDLKTALNASRSHPTPSAIPNLATPEERYKVTGRSGSGYTNSNWAPELTWSEIFSAIAPYLTQRRTEAFVTGKLAIAAARKSKASTLKPEIDDHTFQIIKIQLLALNFVQIEYLKATSGEMVDVWSLTELGRESMLRYCSIKTNLAST
jgi:Domain of unknown function (DUF4062)